MAYLRSLTFAQSHQPLPLYRDSNIKHPIKLDLYSLYVRRPSETFLVHVKNPNLIAWGIELDDLLIVENNQSAEINDLLVLEKNQEYKFYQFFSEINGEKILFSLDTSEPNLRIKEWSDVNIAGVITNIVHQVKHRALQKNRLSN
ncbi:LexA family protein [Glaesserella parasuis]|uniref:LexA family protein n=1 Tax=Glaesserella parasuis TaxID=738 RepID=UPI003B674354